MDEEPERADARTKSDLVDRNLRFIAQRYGLAFYIFMCEPTLGQPIIRLPHEMSKEKRFSNWLAEILHEDPTLFKVVARAVDKVRSKEKARSESLS